MDTKTGLLYCCYVLGNGKVVIPGEAEFPSNMLKPKALVQGIIGRSVNEQTAYDRFMQNVGSIVDGLAKEADAKKQPLRLDDVVTGLVENGYSARVLSPVFAPKTL